MTAPDAPGGLTFDQVLAAEQDCILEGRAKAGLPPDDLRWNTWGLAFSGGGIRSATFNLGVLEALCRARLFACFDYLSTVSGGGFIGGWAIGEILHRCRGHVVDFEAELADGGLNDSLTHLLRYRNYLLGPDANATSEAWKRGVLYAAGLIANLILLFVTMTSVLLAARCFIDVMAYSVYWHFSLALWLVVPPLIALGLSLQPSRVIRDFGPTAGDMTRPIVWAVVIASVGVAEFAGHRFVDAPEWIKSATAASAGYVTFLASLIVVSSRASRQGFANTISEVVLAALPAVVQAGIVGYAAYWIGYWVHTSRGVQPYAVAVIGLVCGIMALASALLFHLQMAGESVSELLRDKLEDVAPRLILVAGAWLVVGSIASLGPFIVHSILQSGTAYLLELTGAIGLALALVTFLLVRGIGRGVTLAIVCAMVSLAACVGSYVGFRATIAIEMWWTSKAQPAETMLSLGSAPGWEMTFPLLAVELAVAGASVLLLVTLLLLFDVNRSALLRLYRGALARCFLARHSKDAPGLESDFPLCQAATGQRPFHIVNATANAWSLVGATVPFTFSALHCGIHDVRDTRISYRPTAEVSGGHLSLATALAISGAAVSPNARGFGGPLGFALGLANARLGSWMGNPAHPNAWRAPSPSFGGLYWFRELFGSKRSDAPYLYLTDGGHFENLGIYELVARRCRVIFAVDAGWDPDMAFEDLANAVRRCATDLSVPISIDSRALMHGNARETPIRAIGRIHYAHVDGPVPDGTLIYIKPSLSRDVSIDVMSYAIQHPDFPQQSTADQFFDEAQFESYRKLGLHVGTTILADPEVQHVLGQRAADPPPGVSGPGSADGSPQG